LNPSHYTLRPSLLSDLPLLPDIERRAGAIFAEWNAALGFDPDAPIHVNPLENFIAAHERGRLLVAADGGDNPVGFALLLVVDDAIHLEELDVLPAHGRKGIGAALVEAVCDLARERGYPAVTLSTFRDVPWNGPFYARHGFTALDRSELTPQLARFPEYERAQGLRVDLRVIMRRLLS
jgi:4-diphosphocytidyl-2-C-methyl-D-erythritol kinase